MHRVGPLNLTKDENQSNLIVTSLLLFKPCPCDFFFLLLFPPFTLYRSSYGVFRCAVFSSGSPRKSIKYLYPLSYHSINCRYNFLLLKRRNLTCTFGLRLLKLRLLVVFIHRCDLLNEFRNVSSCVGGAIPLAWTRGWVGGLGGGVGGSV